MGRVVEVGLVSDLDFTKWVFPKIGVPQNGWFIVENPIKMDDLIFGNTHIDFTKSFLQPQKFII